jgi:uncharacterized protein (DUF1697 family)
LNAFLFVWSLASGWLPGPRSIFHAEVVSWLQTTGFYILATAFLFGNVFFFAEENTSNVRNNVKTHFISSC